MLQVKTPCKTEKKGFGYLCFQKISKHTLENRLKLSPVLKGQPTPCKTA